MRPLSDGERAILAQDGPEEPFDDYLPLGPERRGVSSGRRTCTACGLKMPAGTRWVASFGLLELDCGTRAPEWHCRCEGACPQTERLCDACGGCGGMFFGWERSDADGELVDGWRSCSACDGKGRVPKVRAGAGREAEP